jgi:hypothetical protein
VNADGEEDGGPEVVGPPWVRGLDAPPGTVWTRADGLRLGDLVSIGDDAEDRSARIVAIEPGGSPGRLRLGLAFEVDGALIVQCSQTPGLSTRYLRQLPEPRPSAREPLTTVEGLASAERIYDRAWDADGTVAVRLPARVAGQLLHERGWRRFRGAEEAGQGWRAPTGELSVTSDAVRMALTAEYADASTVLE